MEWTRAGHLVWLESDKRRSFGAIFDGEKYLIVGGDCSDFLDRCPDSIDQTCVVDGKNMKCTAQETTTSTKYDDLILFLIDNQGKFYLFLK